MVALSDRGVLGVLTPNASLFCWTKADKIGNALYPFRESPKNYRKMEVHIMCGTTKHLSISFRADDGCIEHNNLNKKSKIINPNLSIIPDGTERTDMIGFSEEREKYLDLIRKNIAHAIVHI